MKMHTGMNYATLDLHRTCNYTCSYCYLSKALRKRGMGQAATQIGIKKIIDFFNERGEWHIEISGGEPSLNPYYIELCQALTENHFITIATNNSMPLKKVKEFISLINPEKVDFILCSLQEADESGERFNEFFEKVELYHSNNFKPYVGYVPVPNRLNKIENYYKKFYNRGIPFVVQVYAGTYDGLEYPKSYTLEDRAYINKYEMSAVYRAKFELAYNNGMPITAGKMCNAGYNNIRIDCISGEIFGCSLDLECIGNIYDNSLKLLKAPKKCVFKKCSCVYTQPILLQEILYSDFKNMFSGRLVYENDLLEQYLEKSIPEKDFSHYEKEGIIHNNEILNLIKKQKLVDTFKNCESKNIGIYGTGNHTEVLLKSYKALVGDIDFKIFFLNSDIMLKGHKYLDSIIYHTDDIPLLNLDKIVISSLEYQNDILDNLEQFKNDIEIICLYKDHETKTIFIDCPIEMEN